MRHITRRSKGGVTLIELLIVTALLSVLAGAVYVTLSNGLKIWSRATQAAPEEDICIFFDKFALDLKNCIRSEAFLLTGETDRFRFPTIIYSPRMRIRTVGEVSYTLDPAYRTLRREERDMSQIYYDDAGEERQALTGVTKARFGYYAFSEEKQEFEWLPDWNKETLPLAVRIEVEIAYAGTRRTFTKTVTVPVAR